jgi:hypothetical protein
MFGGLAAGCGGVDLNEDPSETPVAFAAKLDSDTTDPSKLVYVEEFSGVVEYPSTNPWPGIAGGRVLVKPLTGANSGTIIQVNTSGWDFFAEWHRWEVAVSPIPGDFSVTDPDCVIAGQSNDYQNLLWITVYASSTLFTTVGNCVIDVTQELFVNVRPLFHGRNKSCDDVVCRITWTDTSALM